MIDHEFGQSFHGVLLELLELSFLARPDGRASGPSLRETALRVVRRQAQARLRRVAYADVVRAPGQADDRAGRIRVTGPVEVTGLSDRARCLAVPRGATVAIASA